MPKGVDFRWVAIVSAFSVLGSVSIAALLAHLLPDAHSLATVVTLIAVMVLWCCFVYIIFLREP